MGKIVVSITRNQVYSELCFIQGALKLASSVCGSFNLDEFEKLEADMIGVVNSLENRAKVTPVDYGLLSALYRIRGMLYAVKSIVTSADDPVEVFSAACDQITDIMEELKNGKC